eukprot:52393-Rhodomonas_salina.1
MAPSKDAHVHFGIVFTIAITSIRMDGIIVPHAPLNRLFIEFPGAGNFPNVRTWVRHNTLYKYVNRDSVFTVVLLLVLPIRKLPGYPRVPWCTYAVVRLYPGRTFYPRTWVHWCIGVFTGVGTFPQCRTKRRRYPGITITSIRDSKLEYRVPCRTRKDGFSNFGRHDASPVQNAKRATYPGTRGTPGTRD